MTDRTHAPPADGSVVVLRATAGPASPTVVVPSSGVDIEAVERALIRFALDTCGHNRTRAARFLGITRSALLYRMHKYRLGGRTPLRGHRMQRTHRAASGRRPT